MAMYVDLLTRALGKREEEHRSDDLLLADVTWSRARLRGADEALTTSVAEALARELSYDGALVRLCAALDVATTPAGFANPPRERSRLERELSERGIELEPELQSA
jgi:hypothetical protein